MLKKAFAPLPFLSLCLSLLITTPAPLAQETILVPAQTPLIDLKTKQVFKVKKPFYGHVLPKEGDGQMSYLLDKKRKARYQIRTLHLISLKKEIKLLPQLDPLEVYEKRRNFHTTDEVLPIKHFFNYRIQAMTTNFYPTLFRGNSKTALAYGFQVKNYYDASLSPIHFGLGFAYDLGYWEDPKVGRLTWSGLFLGPTLHTRLKGKKNSIWHFHLGAGQSLFHHSQKGPDRHRYSTSRFSLEVERSKPIPYGEILVGAELQWIKSSVTSTTELIINQPAKGSSLTLGLSIGYLYHWNL